MRYSTPMDEPDFGTFERAFGRVSSAFRLKLKDTEQSDLARTYFRVLEGYRLDEVLAAGKTCLQKHRHFPRPAEWLEALASTSRGDAAACPPDRRQVSVAELEERAQAEGQQYRGAPCDCLLCQSAGVTDRELRFVPSLMGDEEERAFNPRRHLVEIVGHWAHGEELGRWYAARDRFYLQARRATVRFPHLLRLVDREPGQEG